MGGGTHLDPSSRACVSKGRIPGQPTYRGPVLRRNRPPGVYDVRTGHMASAEASLEVLSAEQARNGEGGT